MRADEGRVRIEVDHEYAIVRIGGPAIVPSAFALGSRRSVGRVRLATNEPNVSTFWGPSSEIWKSSA
jgi:hypothetical protein